MQQDCAVGASAAQSGQDGGGGAGTSSSSSNIVPPGRSSSLRLLPHLLKLMTEFSDHSRISLVAMTALASCGRLPAAAPVRSSSVCLSVCLSHSSRQAGRQTTRRGYRAVDECQRRLPVPPL
eukprot:GHVU01211430.1.p2 GENE.GHVU01211430.1~~GHVU01211430.1.p2  ORF type:complete len:122 (-),score=24.45 GHVU01211430.1:469-834(-)